MANQYSPHSKKDRDLAKQEGRKFYVSGTPCKKCGCVIKFVSSYGCHYCAKKKGYEKLISGALEKYKTPEKIAQRTRNWRKNNPDKYRAQYKSDESLRKQREKARLPESKEKARDKYYQKLYNITKDEYESLLESQGGKCRICKNTCTSGKRLAVDHCHDNGKVRGLLCKNCNIGLGMFQDNTGLLESAVLYLKEAIGNNEQ